MMAPILAGTVFFYFNRKIRLALRMQIGRRRKRFEKYKEPSVFFYPALDPKPTEVRTNPFLFGPREAKQ